LERLPAGGAVLAQGVDYDPGRTALISIFISIRIDFQMTFVGNHVALLVLADLLGVVSPSDMVEIINAEIAVCVRTVPVFRQGEEGEGKSEAVFFNSGALVRRPVTTL